MGILNNIRSMFGGEQEVATAADPLTKAHRARQQLFAEYWNYYRGRHHKHLKVKQGQPDDNVTVNLSAKVINQSVNFLFGRDVVFEIVGDRGETDEQERSPEEQYLDDVWADDPLRGFSKMDFLQGVALNGSVFGEPFVRLYPAADGDGKPRLVNLDPSLVDVVTNPDDKRDVQAYHIVWRVDETWKRDRIERTDGDVWEIARETWSGANDRWEPTEDGVTTWEYTWPPVFHCQNLKNTRDFWGISDLENADMNDAINFTVSNTGRIIKFHAHPKTIGAGMRPDQVNATAIEGFWTVPDNANVYNLEMQSDLSSSREYARDLMSDFHQITDTPDLDPAKVSVGALSGFALRILYGPLLSKTDSKRLRYGGMLARINAALLELAEIGEGIVVKNVWQNPLPVHAVEQAQVFGQLTAGGSGVYAAAKIAGYSEEQAQLLQQVETFDEGFVR